MLPITIIFMLQSIMKEYNINPESVTPFIPEHLEPSILHAHRTHYIIWMQNLTPEMEDDRECG